MAARLQDKIPILDLTEDERIGFVSHMCARRLEKDELVYQLDDPGSDLFLVYEGLVKSVLYDLQGDEVIVAFFGRAEFFGTQELFEERPHRDRTAVATCHTTLLQIDGEDARAVIERNPAATAFMFRRQSELNRRLENDKAGLLHQDVRGRVAFLLSELSAVLQPVPLTQTEIASAVGASRRGVNAVLQAFARRGLITLGRDGVRVADEPRLRQEMRAERSDPALVGRVRRVAAREN